MYEKSVELTQQKIQQWLSNEVFSFGWFVELTILITLYVIWLILLDKKRAKDILLIGALAAVFFHINLQTLTEIFSFLEYKITLLPYDDELFISSVTLAPVIIILVHQYTKSWKGYILWSAIGMALLNFGILRLYISVGALEFYKGWNLFYHYLTLVIVAIFTKLIFLWIAGTQKRNAAKLELKS